MEKKKLTRILLIAGAALVVVALVAAVVIWSVNEFTLNLSVTGDGEITLEYGTDYADAGATAQFYGTILVQEPEAVNPGSLKLPPAGTVILVSPSSVSSGTTGSL